MAFPKRLLNSFETIRVDLRPHWWYLTPPGGATLLALIFTIYALTLDGGVGKAVKIIALIVLVIAGGWMLGRYTRWYCSHFVVTSHRVIFRAGVLRKSGMQIPLERVNNVNFNQSVFERMLGAGDLLIESGGEDGQERFEDIKHPDRVANIIHEAIEDKIGVYLGAGVQIVWVVNTRAETVTIHCPGQRPKFVNADQQLTAEPVLPGFSVAVADLFR